MRIIWFHGLGKIPSRCTTQGICKRPIWQAVKEALGLFSPLGLGTVMCGEISFCLSFHYHHSSTSDRHMNEFRHCVYTKLRSTWPGVGAQKVGSYTSVGSGFSLVNLG